MHVLLVGCGYVGLPLAAKLLVAGCSVTAIRRTPAKIADGATLILADIAEKPITVLPPVDAVVYLVSADQQTDESYRRAYVEGLRHALELSQGCRRFIFVSSTAVYGQDDGSWVDESSDTVPRQFNGRRLLEGEALVVERCPEGVGVILRFGGIYGPGRIGVFRRLISTEHSAGQDSYLNLIHQEDCIGSIIHLLHLQNPSRIYLGVDDEPALRADIRQVIVGSIGFDPAPVTSRFGNKRCSNTLLRRSGYSFDVPTYRQGVGLLRDELRVVKND